MLRFFVAVFSLIILISCEYSPEQPEYPLQYIGTVMTSYNGVDYSAEVILHDDSIEIIMQSPQSVKGFLFNVNKDETVVKSNSLELKYNTEEFSKLCPFVKLYAVFAHLNENQPEFNAHGKNLICEFEVNSQKCLIYLNKSNGNITSVEFDNCLFKFKA